MKYVFYFLVAVFVITFWSSQLYKNAGTPEPSVLGQPVQEPIVSAAPVTWELDGFRYTASPQFTYDISGLVVSRANYHNWYSLSRTDEVFPTDLCLIWGDNVKDGNYKASGTRFSQDGRWCYVRWKDVGRPINSVETSNNHLLFSNADLEKKLRGVDRGDQVRIKGRLVNLKAESLGTPQQYESSLSNWTSSTVRTDTGGGACEIILIDDIQVLHRNNQASHVLHLLSGWGIILLIACGAYRLLRESQGSA